MGTVSLIFLRSRGSRAWSVNWVYRRSMLLGVLFNMLARTPAYFLVYMESCVGAFGPSGQGCLPGCLEGGQKCPQNVRSVPFLVELGCSGKTYETVRILALSLVDRGALASSVS